MKSFLLVNRTRLLTLTVFLIIVTTLVSVSASATPVSYSYGTNYNDGKVNTLAAAQAVSNSLSNMGYSSNYRPDSSNNNAFNEMGNAQVWFFNGHGAPGMILFKGTGDICIYANHISGLNSIQDRNDIGDMALIVFVSCNSGTTGTNGLGNLVDMSVSKGVDSAVGFTGEIDTTRSDYWAQQFVVRLDQQYNTYDAANQARADTWSHFWGLDGNVGSFTVKGALSMAVDPARFGY